MDITSFMMQKCRRSLSSPLIALEYDMTVLVFRDSVNAEPPYVQNLCADM